MKKFKKLLASILCISLIFDAIGVVALADESKIDTIWHGDNISIDVKAGKDAYTLLSAYPGYSYEFSNHIISEPGGVNRSIPQTLMMIDASKDYTWKPDGKYSFGASNYEVLYCCDIKTGYEDGIYYKRLNLEDSNYFNKEDATKIRSILTNSYPFVSLENMKQNLADEGFADADKLTRADIIAAVQTAVWTYANNNKNIGYHGTYHYKSSPNYGKPVHDYTNEMDVWWNTKGYTRSLPDAKNSDGTLKYPEASVVRDRVDGLVKHLTSRSGINVEKNQMVISDIQVVKKTPIQKHEGKYSIAFQVKLNSSGSSTSDNIKLSVKVGDQDVITKDVTLGTEVYDFIVEANVEDTITTTVSGTQILPQGVYFYEPEGGRDISQSLVGVSSGETTIYDETICNLDIEEYDEIVEKDLEIQTVNKKGKPLVGTKFKLYTYNEDKEILFKTFKVDNKSKLKIKGLLKGKYKLVEDVTPEGYKALEKPVEFSIDEKGLLTVVDNQFASVDENGTLTVLSVPEQNTDEDPFYDNNNQNNDNQNNDNQNNDNQNNDNQNNDNQNNDNQNNDNQNNDNQNKEEQNKEEQNKEEQDKEEQDKNKEKQITDKDPDGDKEKSDFDKNSKTKTTGSEKRTDVPDTGDDTPLGFLMVLAIVSLVGIIFTARKI